METDSMFIAFSVLFVVFIIALVWASWTIAHLTEEQRRLQAKYDDLQTSYKWLKDASATQDAHAEALYAQAVDGEKAAFVLLAQLGKANEQLALTAPAEETPEPKPEPLPEVEAAPDEPTPLSDEVTQLLAKASASKTVRSGARARKTIAPKAS